MSHSVLRERSKQRMHLHARIWIILIVLVIFIGCEHNSNKQDEIGEPCKLYFDIDCEENLFFARYDIALLWDAQPIGTTGHGSSFTAEIPTVTGKHEFRVESTSDQSVYGIVQVTITGDSVFSCELKTKTSKIVIDDLKIINGEPQRPVVPDVIGMTYKDAKKQLKDAGFVNIEYNTSNRGSILAEGNWDVIEQSIEAGSIVDKTETIILTCKKHGEKPATLELITDEGGVVAFSGEYRNTKGYVYVIVDSNTNTLYRISSSANSVSKYTISGDINGTFKAGDCKYYIYKENSSISYVHEEYTGYARTNKSANLKKTDLEIAYRIMEHCYANAEAEAKRDPYSDHFEGQIVFFGQYEQQYSSKSDLEPIEWIVLCSEDDQTLLISKYILTFMQYSDAIGDSSDCTWKNSNIRTWLNTSFFEDAFSPEEAAFIKTTQIKDGDITTNDRVFLLNSSEMSHYFTTFSTKAKPSGYAEYLNTINQLGGNTTTWWLRSSSGGFEKACVNLNGKTDSKFVEKNLGIRPAIWVNTSALQMPEE